MIDGLQYVVGFGEPWFGAGEAQHYRGPLPDWLPPLYPYRWYVVMGLWDNRARQIAIATSPTVATGPKDVWYPPIFEGTFDEAWDVFLTYLNFMEVK